MLKKTRVNLEIPVIEKEMDEIAAKKHGLSLSALLRKGARLLGALTPGFLETIETVFREIKGIQAPIALETNMQKTIAALTGWKKVFGTYPPGILRELKYEDGKLIRGDRLQEILTAEYEELFQSMKEKLMESKEKGEPVTVSVEEFSEFAMML